jgi:hypothetical protein
MRPPVPEDDLHAYADNRLEAARTAQVAALAWLVLGGLARQAVSPSSCIRTARIGA